MAPGLRNEHGLIGSVCNCWRTGTSSFFRSDRRMCGADSHERAYLMRHPVPIPVPPDLLLCLSRLFDHVPCLTPVASLSCVSFSFFSVLSVQQRRTPCTH